MEGAKAAWQRHYATGRWEQMLMTTRARKVLLILTCLVIYGGDLFIHCNEEYQHGYSWRIVKALDFGAEAIVAGIFVYLASVMWQLSTPERDSS